MIWCADRTVGLTGFGVEHGCKEFWMKTRKNLGIFLLIFSLLGFSLPTLAVKTVTPQIGTWAIDEEVNGKPGRGFQIDVQNDVLVLYFYGYEQTGESTYWLAAGRIPDGSDELTADLGEYEGGMAFGDPIKNATYLGSRGKLTIRFTNRNEGEICLPNESCKTISPFNFGFEKSASDLLGSWLVIGSPPQSSVAEAYEFVFDKVVAPTRPGELDHAVGRAVFNINGAAVVVDIVCDRLFNPEPWEYFCKAGAGSESREMYVNLERNGFTGSYRDPVNGDITGPVFGFRSGSARGRVTLPN
jgi:hypothetical protein